jgi:hypothetical protein
MRVIADLVAVTTLWAVTVGEAFAVFSSAPGNGTIPEPATTALFVAGALAAGGLRYLSKRRRDK